MPAIARRAAAASLSRCGSLLLPVPESSSSRLHLSAAAATRIVFFLSGVCVAAWAPLIPFVKDHFQLGDGKLGLVLLCMGLGSIFAMPVAGALTGEWGCRRVIALTLGVACVLLPLLVATHRLELLAAGLFFFGASLGALDVAMNIQAVLVERSTGRALMSGFHGLWSVGGIVGAGLVSVLISAGAPLVLAACSVTCLSACMLAACFGSLLPRGSESSGPAFAWPHGRVILLGCLCCVLFLAEGSVMEWSAVFLNKSRGMDVAHAGIGFIVFATAMTVCRLLGDRVVHALGPNTIVFLGGLCAAAGFTLAATAPWPIPAICGFALVGIGASNAVPVMFSAAGRQTAMPAHLALPAMTTLGYAGSLTGPPLIGLVAQWSGLAMAFGLLGTLLAIVAVLSTLIRL
ncbi:MAG: MFS transporter [Planctomycetes bacterium]|nr:MFS transporter [Planctomycetota bacterium]